ncbi:T9SS type A sorting domain-containing protein [Chryseobacterium indologenes]|uniref:Secretion system C-terminal sorting domain-containing protein n=1 Tax=Chryseobacterium indologenes TaxID=253 RepID=A0A0N0IWA4_CHRID|nr:T9SS type A sorting domain-containing protein [Chryseobacterium indologenes]KPE51174.1 hypothetical protein AOB46_10930 [Chryseobacterium indologenes]
MKKLNFILFAVIGVMGYAQPSITRAGVDRINVPATFRSGDFTAASINAGPAGANITWDFSAYSAVNVITYTTNVCPGQANCFRFSGANRITKPAQAEVYDFTAMTDTEATMLGTYSGPSVGEGTSTYTDPLIEYKFPITYQQQFDDNYQFNGVSATSSMSESGQVSFVADGYGTVITPVGTFSNVMRVKRMRSATQTIPGLPPATYIVESYQWISQNEGVVLSFTINTATFNGNTNTTKLLSYLVPGSLSTLETKNIPSDITVYPNPSADLVTLKSKEDIKKITVHSLDGKVILSAENRKDIDISGLPEGTYILQGILKNGTSVSKKVIKK